MVTFVLRIRPEANTTGIGMEFLSTVVRALTSLGYHTINVSFRNRKSLKLNESSFSVLFFFESIDLAHCPSSSSSLKISFRF